MRYSRSARDRTSRDATMSQRKKEKRLSEGNGDLQRSSKKQQQKKIKDLLQEEAMAGKKDESQSQLLFHWRGAEPMNSRDFRDYACSGLALDVACRHQWVAAG